MVCFNSLLRPNGGSPGLQIHLKIFGIRSNERGRFWWRDLFGPIPPAFTAGPQGDLHV